MKEHIALRVLACAQYMLLHHGTVRGCAEQFGVSKTTIHKDMRVRLPMMDWGLARQVDALLDVNKQQRHMRGGRATQKKYWMMGSQCPRPP